MDEFLRKTQRTRLRRIYERGAFDRETINGILDAMPLCHVGYVIDGKPLVTPTFQWREGEHIYWHGSSASRALRASEDAEVCLSVAILDGFVLARSAFHHSANYRSVMLFGQAGKVTAPAEKADKLRNFVETYFPGRSELLRPNTEQEEKATTILTMPITEGSAKIRAGQPVDDEEDYTWPIWAGVIPVTTTVGAPEADPRNLSGVSIPAHAERLKLG